MHVLYWSIWWIYMYFVKLIIFYDNILFNVSIQLKQLFLSYKLKYT